MIFTSYYNARDLTQLLLRPRAPMTADSALLTSLRHSSFRFLRSAINAVIPAKNPCTQLRTACSAPACRSSSISESSILRVRFLSLPSLYGLALPLPTHSRSTESDHSGPFPEEEDDKEEDAVSEARMSSSGMLQYGRRTSYTGYKNISPFTRMTYARIWHLHISNWPIFATGTRRCRVHEGILHTVTGGEDYKIVAIRI